jgi:glutamine cyclotransferase
MPRKTKARPRKYLLISIALVVLLAIIGVTLVLVLSRPVSSIPLALEPEMTYEVVNAFPHDPEAFTQGLIYRDDVLYESTGLYGRSSLRMADLETGEVQRMTALPGEFFGEGLTDWDETLVQLTWQNGTGFVYGREDFSLLSEFGYKTEGWGLTHDGEHLIMSDGTATLYFLDPDTFSIVSTVEVMDGDKPVTKLNELEYILGEVYANIWQTDMIVRIDPETGAVNGWIGLNGLLPEEEQSPVTDVLNGIAYDPQRDRLFVTGKFWPKLYEIRLVPIDDGE